MFDAMIRKGERMKRIGIVGGLGPEASLYYYRILIDLAHETLGGIKYLEIVIYNLPLNLYQRGAPKALYEATQCLYRAGANFAIIACNDAHVDFDALKARSPILLLSIVEETCKAVAELGLTKVGLFGNQLTMQGHFYQNVFSKKNISIVVPKAKDQAYINSKIEEELVFGITQDETRKGFLEITQRMVDEESIQGLILGCTEIPLLLGKEKFLIPFFDTSRIHAESAFRYSLTGEMIANPNSTEAKKSQHS